MKCTICNSELWGSGDTTECENDQCGKEDKKDEEKEKEPDDGIPVPYVWGV